jgi:hypothetical protein
MQSLAISLALPECLTGKVPDLDRDKMQGI